MTDLDSDGTPKAETAPAKNEAKVNEKPETKPEMKPEAKPDIKPNVKVEAGKQPSGGVKRRANVVSSIQDMAKDHAHTQCLLSNEKHTQKKARLQLSLEAEQREKEAERAFRAQEAEKQRAHELMIMQTKLEIARLEATGAAQGARQMGSEGFGGDMAIFDPLLGNVNSNMHWG